VVLAAAAAAVVETVALADTGQSDSMLMRMHCF
jgi:hypothetical protein